MNYDVKLQKMNKKEDLERISISTYSDFHYLENSMFLDKKYITRSLQVNNTLILVVLHEKGSLLDFDYISKMLKKRYVFDYTYNTFKYNEIYDITIIQNKDEFNNHFASELEKPSEEGKLKLSRFIIVPSYYHDLLLKRDSVVIKNFSLPFEYNSISGKLVEFIDCYDSEEFTKKSLQHFDGSYTNKGRNQYIEDLLFLPIKSKVLDIPEQLKNEKSVEIIKNIL